MNRFGIGNVLATGFRVWFKNIVPFLAITALFYAPLWIWIMVVTPGELDRESLETVNAAQALDLLRELRRLEPLSRAVRASEFLSFPINILVSGSVAYGVVMELQGRRASLGACITIGLTRFFPALGVTLLSSLCIGLASIALVIPGLIVYCMFYVATPASVLERPGITGALSRSSKLTQGHRMRIFGLVILPVLISFGVRQLPDLVTLPLVKQLSWTAYIYLINSMLIGSIAATMTSVAYYFLRAEKEGTSAAELAAVFD